MKPCGAERADGAQCTAELGHYGGHEWPESRPGRALRDITEAEWDAYDWHDVQEFGEAGPIYVRGLKKVTGPPPADGFHYEQVADLAAGEWRWARSKQRGGA